MVPQGLDDRKEIKPKAISGLVVVILVISDVGGAYLSLSLATWFRGLLTPWLGGKGSWSLDFTIVILSLVFILVLFIILNLYPGYGKTALTEIDYCFKALTLVYGFLGVTVYFFKVNPDFPRSIFLFVWVLSLLIIPFLRIILRNRLSIFNWYGKPILFIIKNENDINALNIAIRSRRMGWRPFAVHILENESSIMKISEIPVVTSINEMINLGNKYQIGSVVFTTSPFSGPDQIKFDVIRKFNAHFNSIILIVCRQKELDKIEEKIMETF